MAEIKHIDIKEFRERGYLHEINRRLLHPLGMALETAVDDNGIEYLSGVWDSRDDPEGIYYGDDLLSPAKVANVTSEWNERVEERMALLGFMVQPVSTIDEERTENK